MEGWRHTQALFPRKVKLSFLCFIAISILLIINIFPNIRDSNDEWILAGSLQVYFLLFVVAYCVLVVSSSDLRLVTIATSTFLVIVNLIPNLKYVFIWGYHDPLGHYGFIQDMINLGRVPGRGIYADYYGSAPGLQIFISSLSKVSGLDVSASMKIFMVAFPLILPVAVYFVAKRLNVANGLAKMMVASTAITAPTTYKFMGATQSYYLYVLFLYSFLLLVSTKRFVRSQFLVFLLLGVAITISHSMTSFFLLLCLLAVLFSFKIPTAKIPYKMFRSAFPAMTIIVMSLTYFVFVAKVNFSTILLHFRSFVVNLISAKPPVALSYFGAFYEIGLLEKVGVLAVQMSRDAVSLFLAISAPLAIFRLKLKSEELQKFYRASALPYILAVSLFLATLLLFPFSIRGLYYMAPFSPLFGGATLFYLIYSKHRRLRWALQMIVIFSLICVSFLQMYPFQPILPKISTTYGDYYILDLRQVNTVYDRSMLSFINSYDSRLNIATDYITWWQIHGLTNPSVYSLLTETSPLAARNVTTPMLVIVHVDSVAHAIPSAKDAVAYQQFIRSASQEENILYTNGKSYVLLNLPLRFNASARVANAGESPE